MRKTVVTLSVLVVLLALLLTLSVFLHDRIWPSQTVSVQISSDPKGATLTTLNEGSVLGTTPLTFRYAVPAQWMKCVSYDGLRAKWPNGAQLVIRAIELCPEGGTDQAIRLVLPTERRKHRSRVAPSGHTQQPDELAPMDLSLPEFSAPTAADEPLAPMDLSVPDARVATTAPEGDADDLRPMDLSVEDSRTPPPVVPGIATPTRGVPVRLVGYVDWSREDHLVIDGQRVRWSADTRLKGLPPSAITSAPAGLEAKVTGWRERDGTVWAKDIELKPNGSAMFETYLVAGGDAIERDALESGAFAAALAGGDTIGGRIQRSGPDVERCKNVLRRLLPPSHRASHNRVYVVEAPIWNAVVLPNGSVWVFRELLDDVRSDHELAVVLGHELAHFTYEHMRRRVRQEVWASLVGQAAGVAISEIRSDTARNIAAISASLALSAWVNGYSRDQEAQADRVGLRYAFEAGFDVTAGPAIWYRMALRGDADPVTAFFTRTHPRSMTRAERLDDEIRNNYRSRN